MGGVVRYERTLFEPEQPRRIAEFLPYCRRPVVYRR